MLGDEERAGVGALASDDARLEMLAYAINILLDMLLYGYSIDLRIQTDCGILPT
jgi:hypothetical protein